MPAEIQSNTIIIASNIPASRLHTIFGGKTSYRLGNRGPDYNTKLSQLVYQCYFMSVEFEFEATNNKHSESANIMRHLRHHGNTEHYHNFDYFSLYQSDTYWEFRQNPLMRCWVLLFFQCNLWCDVCYLFHYWLFIMVKEQRLQEHFCNIHC